MAAPKNKARTTRGTSRVSARCRQRRPVSTGLLVEVLAVPGRDPEPPQGQKAETQIPQARKFIEDAYEKLLEETKGDAIAAAVLALALTIRVSAVGMDSTLAGAIDRSAALAHRAKG
jgi:hypothetical protein